LSTIIYHLLDLSSSLSIAEISYDYGLFFNWMSWRKEEKHFLNGFDCNNTCKCLFFESVGEFSFVGNNNDVFLYTLLYPNPKLLFWSIGEGSRGRTFRFSAPPLGLKQRTKKGILGGKEGPQTRKWVGEFMGARSIQTLLKASLTKVVKCPCIILFGWKFAKKKTYENAWGLKKCTC
jgi:hypothetical protein